MSRRIPVTLLLSLALLAGACGDDSAGPIFGSDATTTTATITSDTATTAAPDPTTAPETTATTAAPEPTEAPPPTLGEPPLPPLVFSPFGLGVADFGDDPETVIATVGTLLGAPSLDSGWIPGGGGPYGVCPGTQYRRVEYLGGDLAVQFTDAGYFAPEGTPQFYAYSWYGGEPGPTPGHPVSVDSGSTVQQVLDLYPGAEVLPDDVFFGPVFRVSPGGWAQLWGTLTGITPTDTVINIVGGVGCGE